MTQQITPLPAPPQPSDSPVEFDQKAFALLGGLPQFVNEANTLGGQMTELGENSAESAAAALASKNAAATSASNSAGHASAALTSAYYAENCANRAYEFGIDAQAASRTAETIASGMENAIAFANTFTAVPTTNQGPMIVVTQPHLRFMVWNGTKYVRAPWHMPGVLFFSHAPAANVTHGIQVRADVTYNKADYPDLAEILGVPGSTFVLPEGRARVLRAADNGRGINTALVNGYLQEDMIRNIIGEFGSAFGNDDGSGAVRYNFTNTRIGGVTVNPADQYFYGARNFDASRVVPTGSENTVKSLVATLYITK